MIKFSIYNNVTGHVMFEAQIDASDDMPMSKKLGLAVKKACPVGADLSYANLKGAYLSYVNFRGTNFRGADLSYVNFRGANFRGADLKGADLSFTDLKGADLSYAKLRGTNFRGADLTGADLSFTDFKGADLSYVYTLIDGGQDKRGFRFIAQQRSDGNMNIRAGCHYFESLADARAHWESAHKTDLALRAECLAKIDQFEAVAKAREWGKKDA